MGLKLCVSPDSIWILSLKSQTQSRHIRKDLAVWMNGYELGCRQHERNRVEGALGYPKVESLVLDNGGRSRPEP